MPAVIQSYKVYGTDMQGKSQLLVQNENNHFPSVEHDIEEVSIISMEIEILSTHGANRAQIYKVRAYT